MLLGHTKQINGVWKIQSLKQHSENVAEYCARACHCLLYTSPSPRDRTRSRMPSSA